MKKNINEVSNGRLTNLTKISTGGGKHQLNPEAAAAYEKMVQAAKAENVTWGITDSYRNYEQQVDVAKRKGLYSQGGLAAEPGTSNHGWGAAVDLDFKNGASGNPFEWLKKNASKFGFTNIPREDWHWEHKQSAKNLGADVSTSTSTSSTSSPDTNEPTDGITWSNILKPIGTELKKFGFREEYNRFQRLSNMITESVSFSNLTKPVDYSGIISLSKQSIILKVEPNTEVSSPEEGEVIEKTNNKVVINVKQRYDDYNITFYNLTNVRVNEGDTIRGGKSIGKTDGRKIKIEVDKGDLRVWFKKKEVQQTNQDDTSGIKNLYKTDDTSTIKNLYQNDDSSTIKNLYQNDDTSGIKNLYSKNINEEIEKIKRLLK